MLSNAFKALKYAAITWVENKYQMLTTVHRVQLSTLSYYDICKVFMK